MNKINDIAITIAGEAGQGLDAITDFITIIFKAAEYNVFACKEFMSRIRGGTNSSQIRISSSEVSAYVDKIDILFALSQNAVEHLQKNITNETFIVYDDVLTGLDLEKYRHIAIPITSSAIKSGGKIFSNTIVAGIIFGMFNIDKDLIKNFIKKFFSDKPEDMILKNIEAMETGYNQGQEIFSGSEMTINVQKGCTVKRKILVNGSEAVALGCIAGGCDFISSYPMSPSTGVLTYLAQKSNDFNIIVEQAEDEISAINMGIGAWSVGARAMVTTSGGGFDLMAEGLSLSGMIESPMVIHLAQRPGPATGCPTRTEQGDLNLALYAGHGDFPRIILTPGTHDEAFYMAQNAFNLADKYQIPVFILTDQYLLDSISLCPCFEPEKTNIQDFIVKTELDYKRYQFTEDGISPRGIPKYGDSLIKLCSDEHDEDGHSTENFDLRIKMTDKRLKKFDSIKNDVYLPELLGKDNYRTLLIGWGSTCNAINEAMDLLNDPDISFLHFKQVYPLPKGTFAHLEYAQKVICIENNATGQFANLIKQETGFHIIYKILKYNGQPFSVEELAKKIKDLARD